MKKASGGTSRRAAIALGLAATLAVLAGHLAGLDRWVELGSLDWRFRTLATAPESEEVVNVNIDDHSLGELGRWPWPREQLAGAVEVLFRCGARAVALDIILPEPQEERYRPSGAGVYDEAGELVGQGQSQAVFDDQELARVIAAEANRIFLPMFFSPVAEAEDRASALESVLEAMIARRPLMSLVQARQEILAAGGELAGLLGADSAALRRAYLRARAMHALAPLGMDPSAAGSCRVPSGTMVPPLVRFVEPLRYTGFVTVDPESDGVVRRIPLLAVGGGRVFPQFALAVAKEELARRHGGLASLSAAGDRVNLVFADGFRREVPVDEKGYMLINWMPAPEGVPARSQVPISAVGQIQLLDRDIEQVADRRRLCCKDLLALHANEANFRTEAFQELYYDMSGVVARLGALNDESGPRLARAQAARLFDPASSGSAAPQETDETKRKLLEEFDRAIPAVLEELRDPSRLDQYLGATTPASSATVQSGLVTSVTQANASDGSAVPDASDFAARKRKAISRLRMMEAAPAEQVRLQQARQDREADLRRKVDNKICLIGSTATGAADFVPTPMLKRTPGSFVHTNILNTILSGRFVRPAHWAWNAAAILLAGLLVSWVTATRPAGHSGPLTILLGAAYAAFAALVVFRQWDVWLAMVAPLAAMALAYAVVTAWRQLTEERAKRHIRGLFAHALSPALVDRLTEDPSLLKLGGEKRVLSCFFSDLEGFTPLSERLGEQETVRLLNRYFDRMTGVIQHRHGGYLNKFLGDGIFVFFGAPVFQDDHAARAVRSAAECLTELPELNRQLSADLKMDVRLSCRIGIATGEVMVGNCGSTEKFDYSAIGDTVNLASRLEGANKFFGTRILVDDATWGRGGTDGMVARRVGRIQVVGKAEPVAVWNVLGRKDDLAPEAIAAAGEFSRAIDLYTARDFAAAAEILEKYQAVIPGDRATGVYLELCRRLAVSPPGPDWDGTVQLTEK